MLEHPIEHGLHLGPDGAMGDHEQVPDAPLPGEFRGLEEQLRLPTDDTPIVPLGVQHHEAVRTHIEREGRRAEQGFIIAPVQVMVSHGIEHGNSQLVVEDPPVPRQVGLGVDEKVTGGQEERGAGGTEQLPLRQHRGGRKTRP